MAICDFTYEITHITPMAILLSGVTFIQLRLCFYLSVVPLLGLNFSIIMMFFIAADRLVAVVLPVWHRSLNVSVFVFSLCGMSLAYALVMIIPPYQYALENYNKASICILNECFQGPVGHPCPSASWLSRGEKSALVSASTSWSLALRSLSGVEV